MGRTYNSLRNVKVNLLGQLASNVLRFVCRTVFIYVLGEEFLGISSLYSNILLLLSVSELGFSSAITYSLYRPLAENDTKKISAIMAFYKLAYRVIGLAILGLGLLVIPFLPTLMNGTTEKVNIYLYYVLYLAQTVVTYFFFAYKQAILLADQKKYLVDLVIHGVNVVLNVVQIVVLLVRRSFLEYTILAILSGITINILLSVVVDKRYSYLKEKADKLSKLEVKGIFGQVYAQFLYRVCNIVGMSTDNLIISSHIGVLVVGLYDNYAMIINVIQDVLASVLHSFAGSLGNLHVLESDKKNEQVFRCLNLCNLWFITFASVCFLVLFQPFITLWIGPQYLFEESVVFIIVMNFATNYMQAVVQIYKDTTGLFVRGKYRPVATVILNLVLSLIWVKTMGISGVFLGSIVSRLCTTWSYDAWLIHRHAFHVSPVRFYWDCVVTAVLIIVLAEGIHGLCLYCAVPGGWLGLILRGILCVVIVNGVLWIKNRKKEEFQIVAGKGKDILMSLWKRVKK